MTAGLSAWRGVLALASAMSCACASKAPPAAEPDLLAAGDVAAAPIDWEVPLEERARTNPLPVTSPNLLVGRALFGRNCSACHGSKGRGDGPVAELWARLPKDLANPVRQARLTDGEIFWKVTNGHHQGSEVIMPGFGDRYSAENLWRIVLYVRSLSAPSP